MGTLLSLNPLDLAQARKFPLKKLFFLCLPSAFNTVAGGAVLMSYDWCKNISTIHQLEYYCGGLWAGLLESYHKESSLTLLVPRVLLHSPTTSTSTPSTDRGLAGWLGGVAAPHSPAMSGLLLLTAPTAATDTVSHLLYHYHNQWFSRDKRQKRRDGNAEIKVK